LANAVSDDDFGFLLLEPNVVAPWGFDRAMLPP
jgi:hypothetical protein